MNVEIMIENGTQVRTKKEQLLCKLVNMPGYCLNMVRNVKSIR